MLDIDKPRRPREEEAAEILDFFAKQAERAEADALARIQPSLAAEVAQREADEEARLQAREREETPQEREVAERLLREEADMVAEVPILHAQERRRQATSPIGREAAKWYERHAS